MSKCLCNFHANVISHFPRKTESIKFIILPEIGLMGVTTICNFGGRQFSIKKNSLKLFLRMIYVVWHMFLSSGQLVFGPELCRCLVFFRCCENDGIWFSVLYSILQNSHIIVFGNYIHIISFHQKLFKWNRRQSVVEESAFPFRKKI